MNNETMYAGEKRGYIIHIIKCRLRYVVVSGMQKKVREEENFVQNDRVLFVQYRQRQMTIPFDRIWG